MACDIMKKTILENMKGDISMAEFGKNDVTIHFNFNDKNARKLCWIPVIPEEWYRKAIKEKKEKEGIEESEQKADSLESTP